ncbi:Retrotransposon gag domain [Sesbania bispinosa]|nr:Retrotransposon gag domain [Sesbania bispinosa]
MAENTRMKELQNEVKNNVEDLLRLSTTVEKLEAALAAQSKSQDKKMDQIQLMLHQLIENVSQSHGSPTNSGSPIKVTPINSIPLIKDISLGFPHFDGSTLVLEWIFKAYKFFNYHNTLDSYRVEITSMHFEKEVVPWFQMLQKIEAVTTWTTLTRALESQFGPSPFDCPMAYLFKLQQNGSVSDYYLKFIALANRSGGLIEEAVLNCFISGLNVDIKRDVVAMTPVNLLRAVALAKLYEEKYTSIPKPSLSYPNRFTTSSSYSNPYNSLPRNTPKTVPAPKSTAPPLLPTPLGPPLKNPNVKRISPAEIQCFVLQLGEKEHESEKEPPDDTVEHELPTMDDHHLSLNALKGGLGVGTIKFKAYIGTLSVTVLIDGGSSNNFLQPRVAKFLKLPVVQAPMFRVMVGNGNYMVSEGLIQDLKLQAQGNVFKLSAFLLPIFGANLILGASWLKTIGPHLADYDTLQIKFLQGGKFTTLQGDNDNLPETAQLHHIRRMVNTNAIAEVYEYNEDDPPAIQDSLKTRDALLNKLKQSYPKFNLEDKVAVKEGSIVTSVKNDSKMAGELVNRDGHVASDAKNKELRKSSRKRRESVKLRDYIQ